MSSIFPGSLFSGEASVQDPYSKCGVYPGATGSLKRTPFPAWSVAEDVKRNTRSPQEVGSMGSKGTGPAGKIELYSGKYYASCITGGILACVCGMILIHLMVHVCPQPIKHHEPLSLVLFSLFIPLFISLMKHQPNRHDGVLTENVYSRD